ncbi:MAG: type II toxin-antitoxin system HicB family antitoxin [Bryobacterales bacterium]|nr:type II toxin-antitoxin system HicB family antitoxin [Bryobacterales bacterium]
MKEYTAVVEQDPETGIYVGYVPGFPGAHSRAATLDELNTNLREVMGMLLKTASQYLKESLLELNGSRSPDHGKGAGSQAARSSCDFEASRLRRGSAAWFSQAVPPS